MRCDHFGLLPTSGLLGFTRALLQFANSIPDADNPAPSTKPGAAKKVAQPTIRGEMKELRHPKKKLLKPKQFPPAREPYLPLNTSGGRVGTVTIASQFRLSTDEAAADLGQLKRKDSPAR